MANIADRIETQLQQLRGIVLKPFLRLLTSMHIKADHVTLLGFFFSLIMLFFLVKGELEYGLLFFVLYFVCDFLDGSVARFQKTANDKSKFLDVGVDTTVAILLLIGLEAQQYVQNVQGSLFVLLLTSVLILSVIYNQSYLKTDWLFKCKAGFFPQAPKNIFYVFFVLLVFDINYLNPALIALNIMLLIELLFYSYNLFLGGKRK